MSEVRQPTEIWQIILPKKQGKKVAKNYRLRIELFPARLWKAHCKPSTTLFHPVVPMHTARRIQFWEKEHYRLRINGCWFREKAKFQFFTKEQIIDRYLLNNKAIR